MVLLVLNDMAVISPSQSNVDIVKKTEKGSNDNLFKEKFQDDNRSEEVQGDENEQLIGELDNRNQSLQDAFLNFQLKRKLELQRINKRNHPLEGIDLVSPDIMERRRKEFMNYARSYIGVPYSRKYHLDCDSPYYNAPLYLDCCGLIRQVLRNMSDELGFSPGRWNQAYQFDTLPDTGIEFAEDAKPGDLVFYTGNYYSPSAKQQIHNIVHVEILLGNGSARTLGARWQKGCVCQFEHYNFEAKSYSINGFFFRSIDPWLAGICQSFCQLHPWTPISSTYIPGKKSIFYDDKEESNNEDEPAEDDDAQPFLPTCYGKASDTVGNRTICGTKNGTTVSSERGKNKSTITEKKIREMASSDSSTVALAKVTTKSLVPAGKPVFCICDGNNSLLVANTLLSMGWEQVSEAAWPFSAARKRATMCLRWAQSKSLLDYKGFREGFDIVNHVPDYSCLTTKDGLLISLRKYAHRGVGTALEIMPETYRLYIENEREQFLKKVKADKGIVSGHWISKPIGLNQGKGIFVVDSLHELGITTGSEKAQASSTHAKNSCRNGSVMRRIVQRYLRSPLLLEGRKFDVRAYLHVTSVKPYIAFFHKGYLRLSLEQYTTNDPSNRAVHLTNQCIQRQHPQYKDLCANSIWSMERFQSYIDEHYSSTVPCKDWTTTAFSSRMCEIMRLCVEATRDLITRKMGFFDLLGFDFMVDDSFGVHLIEVNVNPALFTSNPVLEALIPGIVDEALKLSIEAFMKKREGNLAMRLDSQRAFKLVYADSELL